MTKTFPSLPDQFPIFLSPENLPNPGMEHRSPALRVDSLLAEPPGKPLLLFPSPPDLVTTFFFFLDSEFHCDLGCRNWRDHPFQPNNNKSWIHYKIITFLVFFKLLRSQDKEVARNPRKERHLQGNVGEECWFTFRHWMNEDTGYHTCSCKEFS